LCVYGIFPDIAAARAKATELSREGTEGGVGGGTLVDAFVVESLGKWIPVVPVQRGVAEEEEEIAAAENEDPPLGRMGSVCDVRKHSTQQHETPNKKTTPPPDGSSSSSSPFLSRYGGCIHYYNQLSKQLFREKVSSSVVKTADVIIMTNGKPEATRRQSRPNVRNWNSSCR
jgi:hypothetical protein